MERAGILHLGFLTRMKQSDRSEEHTSELQSPCNLVCRIIISEKHTSELQSPCNLVCRLLLEKKKKNQLQSTTNLENNTKTSIQTSTDMNEHSTSTEALL